MPYALPVPISARLGSLLIDTYATVPATTLIPDCRNILFGASNEMRDYSGSSTAGFAKRYPGGYDTKLSFSLYPNGGFGGPIRSHDLIFKACASGGALAAVADVSRITAELTSDNKKYNSSSTGGRYRRVAGRKDCALSFEMLSQNGVALAAPAWCVEGTAIDFSVLRGVTSGLTGAAVVASVDPEMLIETEDIVKISVDCFNNALAFPTGELLFAHAPGAYISVRGMDNATKGIDGVFIIDRVSLVIDILACALVEQTVECSGDGGALTAVSI